QYEEERRDRSWARHRQADRRNAWWLRLDGVRARQGRPLSNAAPDPRREPEGPAMSKRILVVEDQADLRGILRVLLTGSGYEMLEAADGGEGVAKAKSERPDL